MAINILQRGTTPTHSFTLPDELKDASISSLYVTYKQNDGTVVEKSVDELSVSDGTVSVDLTQDDTLLFKANKKASVQIRLKLSSGQAFASDMIDLEVRDVLKDGVI